MGAEQSSFHWSRTALQAHCSLVDRCRNRIRARDEGTRNEETLAREGLDRFYTVMGCAAQYAAAQRAYFVLHILVSKLDSGFAFTEMS